MNPQTATLAEITNLLGVSKNQVKSMMKKNGVHHDGSPEMRYPLVDSKKVIDKHLDNAQRVAERREKISARRRGKNNGHGHGHDQSPAEVVSESCEEGLSRQEVSTIWGIDTYHVKQAIRNGFVGTLGNGKLDPAQVHALTGKEVLSRLLELKEYTSENVANFLQVSVEDFIQFAKDEGFYNEQDSYNGLLVDELTEGRFKADPFFGSKRETEKIFTYSPNVTVRVPSRSQRLPYAEFHLGPTNSGKTYKALNNLCEEYEKNPQGRYVYSAPLRMLAYEVYMKMVDKYGEEEVGFITGEESVNPDAPIIAATVEMTPLRGDVVVIDEAHWIRDEERGHYWTRLLAEGVYAKMHIISAEEACEGLTELVSDAVELHTQTFKRRTKISYDGETMLNKVKPKTAMVCFTRKDVHDIYHRLLDNDISACVLYGALPAKVRKQQVEDYENGKYDVVVTTNVIGHGVNLPIDNVVFCGTERFDGVSRDTIPAWEAGQISGRAGRFGISERGSVTRLYAIDSKVDEEIVRLGVNVAAGRESSGISVESPYIFPSLEDLGLVEGEQPYLAEALKAWKQKVELETEFSPAPMRILFENLKAITENLALPMAGMSAPKKPTQWRMTLEELWTLVSGPFNPAGVIVVASEWLNLRNDRLLNNDFIDRIRFDKNLDLKNLEDSFEAVGEYKMLSIAFGEDGKLGTLTHDSILSAEDAITNLIQSKLDGFPEWFAKTKEKNLRESSGFKQRKK